MIKDKSVEMKISSKTYKMYYEKYGPYKKNDIINVNIVDLSKSSIIRVNVTCDICGVENKIRYQNYLVQINKGGYYCCKKCGDIKLKNTNQIKYGVNYPQQNQEIREKSLNTVMEKYGVINISCLEEIKSKKKETCIEKYGVDNYNQSTEGKEKYINTCIKKYGFENPSQVREFKEKKIQTCLKNYGVENPSQNWDLFVKSQKSGKRIKLHSETGLYYRGSYEKDFLDYCFSNKINVEKGLTIKFNYNGRYKYYHSDFYIKEINLIIEIKSDYYYEKYLELNKLKEKETITQGYNYKVIINKNYDNFIYPL